LFKKWLNIEIRIGDVQGQEKAKEKAREWVVANAKPEEGADGSEDEDDE
jgi:rRNA biogenesis protein RRP5